MVTRFFYLCNKRKLFFNALNQTLKMLIYTPEELRLHLPNHAYDDIDSMQGAFRRSEADVLKEKIGAELYRKLVEHYNAVDASQRVGWLLQTSSYDPWAELAYECQQIIVFDAFMRSADINAISVNQSGINIVSAENYDVAGKESIAAYKKQLNQELHAAINRLLLWLEELAQEVAQDESDESDDESSAREIVTLWKSAKYYYLISDLFIRTATVFNRFVDIYDSREKFINLLPDLRYCQHHCIENELGDTLTEDLLKKSNEGTGNDKEKKLIAKIQEALALCVEDRSKFFDRKKAHDEAIGAIARVTEYARWNILSLDQQAAQSFPDYAAAKEQAEARANAATEEDKPQPQMWQNNRPDNAMLVMPTVF